MVSVTGKFDIAHAEGFPVAASVRGYNPRFYSSVAMGGSLVFAVSGSNINELASGLSAEVRTRTGLSFNAVSLEGTAKSVLVPLPHEKPGSGGAASHGLIQVGHGDQGTMVRKAAGDAGTDSPAGACDQNDFSFKILSAGTHQHSPRLTSDYP